MNVQACMDFHAKKMARAPVIFRRVLPACRLFSCTAETDYFQEKSGALKKMGGTGACPPPEKPPSHGLTGFAALFSIANGMLFRAAQENEKTGFMRSGQNA